MLSLSAEASQTDIDLQIVNGAESAVNSDGSSGGVEFANQLMKFAEAVASRDETTLTSARADLLRVGGNDVLVDAAGRFRRAGSRGRVTAPGSCWRRWWRRGC